MKILAITGDKRALVPGTAAYKRIELQRSRSDKLDVIFWSLSSPFSIFLLTETYDMVTVQDPFWRGLAGWLVARYTGAKLNVQVHADLAGQSRIKRILAWFLLRRADSVRAVSEKVREAVVRTGTTAPVCVLPVFIDLSAFKNLEKRPHPRFKKVLLWMGRFEREKKPQEAIEVLKEVRHHGIDAGLIYLGQGSLERELRAQAAPVSQYVEFAGWQEPAAYLAMADAVVHSSPHESYGASIVEALAAGVPVVAYDVGIAREAGARIALPGSLAEETVRVLNSRVRGRLAIKVLSEDAWADAWRKCMDL